MPDFPVTEEFVDTANAAQLHDEARGSRVKWPASFTFVDGQWVYRVDREDIDAEGVEEAIANHVPDPDYGLTDDDIALRELRAKKNLTDDDIATAVKLFLKRPT